MSQIKPITLAQGAEAIIIREGNSIIKDRISKKYRHPVLDKKIIKQRTKKEAKLLEKVSKLIPAPCPIPENLKEIDKAKNPNKIIMPFLEGKKLSENLENLNWKEICKIIGNQIAKLHDNDLIHGDLTTSNMIYIEKEGDDISAPNKPWEKESKSKQEDLHINNTKKEIGELVQPISTKQSHEEANSNINENKTSEPKLYFLDFGLGFHSKRIEDKAVDLHLIKQALEAKHFTIHKEAEKIILENYNSKDRTKILEQLKKVELRGRYKH